MLPAPNRLITADDLIVVHAVIGQAHGTKGFNSHSAATRQAWPEHDGIEQITLKADELTHRTVIEWAGER